MSHRLSKRIELSTESPEINMLPLMNIIMLLIPFLIMSTEFFKIGTIDVGAPPLRDTNVQPRKIIETKALNLTVSVTRLGLTLMTRGGPLAAGCDTSGTKAPGEGPTIRKHRGAHNLVALQRCLIKIKQAHPTEKQVVLMAEPAVAYSTIIQVMDASRKYGRGKLLFPVVALSAGVL